jgi:hypothetical protein
MRPQRKRATRNGAKLCPDCGQPDPLADLAETDWAAVFEEMERETEALFEAMRREDAALIEMLRKSEEDLQRLAETRWCGTCGQEIEQPDDKRTVRQPRRAFRQKGQRAFGAHPGCAICQTISEKL